MSELPIPHHFSPDNVGDVWRVDYTEQAAVAERWAIKHGIRPAARDGSRVALFLIDCQNTFCIPGHELFVGGQSGRGAVEDNVRLCEFIYRNLPRITEIIVTLDTHTAMQIFHPVFWVNDAGDHPIGAKTVITPEDLASGTWRVNPAVASVAGRSYGDLERYTRHYVESLSAGRYPLMVWPYHAMLGSVGHALVSALEEAVFFHAMARQTQARFETKGSDALTEHYSVFRPEVLQDEDRNCVAASKSALVGDLLAFDALIIAGQAKSHCVVWSVRDLLTEIRQRDPSLATKVYLLEDCTSPVVVPGVVDFTEPADDAFREFAAAGMHVIRSTDPAPGTA